MSEIPKQLEIKELEELAERADQYKGFYPTVMIKVPSEMLVKMLTELIEFKKQKMTTIYGSGARKTLPDKGT